MKKNFAKKKSEKKNRNEREICEEQPVVSLSRI